MAASVAVVEGNIDRGVRWKNSGFLHVHVSQQSMLSSEKLPDCQTSPSALEFGSGLASGRPEETEQSGNLTGGDMPGELAA
ncbi:hypothetical protein CK203_014289 [Vitis vinifera]|uniref:Uncharacterized protein n=1 Tax=Vitis vinifera TaxID=29760 RepID=A0A438JHU6_VITVI|nr:hypothetical protein CK203_075927 [Vitis vinifera]RVX08521.1 hypothetical protein CK203_014289 [Vitis vinifera]